jgi:hypothetical protein
MTDADAVPERDPSAVMTDAEVVAVARTLTGGSVPDPYPAVSRKRRRGVRVTSAAAITLGLALGGWAVAGAATPSSSPATSGSTGSSSAPGRRPPVGGKPPTASGTVASVGTDTFTLTNKSGTTETVDVGTNTTYVDTGVTSATMADVKVGEHVAVFGTDSSGVITATRVAIGTPPNGGKGGPSPGAGSGGKGGPPGGGSGGPPPGAPSNSSSS